MTSKLQKCYEILYKIHALNILVAKKTSISILIKNSFYYLELTLIRIKNRTQESEITYDVKLRFFALQIFNNIPISIVKKLEVIEEP